LCCAATRIPRRRTARPRPASTFWHTFVSNELCSLPAQVCAHRASCCPCSCCKHILQSTGGLGSGHSGGVALAAE
jgi:hypothetical protein